MYSKALSSVFYVHDLTDTHNWLNFLCIRRDPDSTAKFALLATPWLAVASSRSELVNSLTLFIIVVVLFLTQSSPYHDTVTSVIHIILQKDQLTNVIPLSSYPAFGCCPMLYGLHLFCFTLKQRNNFQVIFWLPSVKSLFLVPDDCTSCGTSFSLDFFLSLKEMTFNYSLSNADRFLGFPLHFLPSTCTDILWIASWH